MRHGGDRRQKSQKDGQVITLPETNIAPENGWLEYDRFLWGWPIFRGTFGSNLLAVCLSLILSTRVQ